MWNELMAMIALALAASVAVVRPSWARQSWLIASLVSFLVAEIYPGVLALLLASGQTSLLLLALLPLPFLSGRWLGLAESFWMARETAWSGVGWGQWVHHQAAAQRAVLAAADAESWNRIAPFFRVAPSLPGHLLAELGVWGLFLWVLVFGVALLLWRRTEGISKASGAFLTLFLLLSIGTTPVQVALTRPSLAVCEKELDRWREGDGDWKSVIRSCPEIRVIEYEGEALERLGEREAAKEAYLRWHRTFPSDVMPLYALGKLAAMDGKVVEAGEWMRLASRGDPRRDERARILKREAEEIASGKVRRLLLWRSL